MFGGKKMSLGPLEVTKAFSLEQNMRVASIKYWSNSFWGTKQKQVYISRESWELIGEVMGWQNYTPELIRRLEKITEQKTEGKK